MLAKSTGIDAYGVEAFYEGGEYAQTVTEEGLLGTRVFALEGGLIPFPESSFEFVTSNQVFEHIDDFSVPLREIHRVLKPHETFINLFPTVEVWREGHIGIPFVHWFPKGLKLRFVYALALRSAGIGYHKKIHSPMAWTRNYLGWIDKWTYYKPPADVYEQFERYFSVYDYSDDYLLYRLARHGRLCMIERWLRPKLFCPLLRFLSNRLSGRVFVLRKL
jgi:SAM-dependent methyltransferase